METIFLGYLGYGLKNIPKTFHLELFLYQRYIRNSNYIIARKTVRVPFRQCFYNFSHFCFNFAEI